ncbi:MAG: site-2 protease family protein [Clostridia bacterium]|jgi:Zn-dependent protease|nr:site-2 protease family protein [Clostridia bacterium]MBT7122564.1 site-2 protease family protein [Clostridia bacterium]
MTSPISSLLSGDITGFLLNILYLLPAIVIALSFHEAAHAWMANRMGDPTAKNLGRLTLDPTKHFTLFGVITFLLIGFGWGKPVPTNPRNYTNYKKGNVLVALAGVTTNLILSFVFYLIYFLLIVFGVENTIVLMIIINIVYINIILCFFNLIPIPPLDGHHLVKGFIARRSQKFYFAYMRYGYFVLLGLIFIPRFISIIPNIFTLYLGTMAGLVLNAYSWFFGLFI